MSAGSSPPFQRHGDDEKHVGKAAARYDDDTSLNSSSDKEVFSLQSVDPGLNAKMHLVNNVWGSILHR